MQSQRPRRATAASLGDLACVTPPRRARLVTSQHTSIVVRLPYCCDLQLPRSLTICRQVSGKIELRHSMRTSEKHGSAFANGLVKQCLDGRV